MNQKTNLILLIIVGLLLSALITKNGRILLLTIPIISYLGTGFLTSSTKVNLRIFRKVENYRVEENEHNSMLISITNLGSDIQSLDLQERIFPGIQLMSGDIHQVIMLPEEQSIEFQYDFHAKRGRYDWREVHLIVSDPFQLFTKEVKQPSNAVSIVFPKKVILPKLKIKPRYTLQSPGLNLSNKPGSGIDFWGIREFSTGDSLGHIHWRLSAKFPNQFFIKQFEQENMTDFGILIDASKSNDSDVEKYALVDYCVEAGAAISRSLLRSGNRVSMFILGKNRTRVYPGIGKHQLHRILDTLAGCEPGDVSLPDLIKFLPLRFFSSRTTIIVISPLIQNDHSLISRLIAEGYQVLLISPNPLPSFMVQNTPSESNLHLRAMRIEREIMLWKIRRMGVNVIDWPIDKPLVNLFQGMRWVRS
jgi:uncharacterized protein (DUF58 family)